MRLLFTFTTFICSLLPSVGFAIDETESLRQRSQDKENYTNMSLDLSGKNGNSNTENIAIGLYHSQRHGKHFGFIMATREYAKSNEVESADNGFAHVRYNYYVSPSNSIEFFVQSNVDDFRSLESRELTGFGYRKELSKYQAIGIGIFDEDENYLVSNKRERFSQFRANLYWVYANQLNPHTYFSNTLYLQPNIADFGDWRGYNKLAINAKITTNIYLSFGYLIEHDSEPVLNVRQTDTSFNAGFGFEF